MFGQTNSDVHPSLRIVQTFCWHEGKTDAGDEGALWIVKPSDSSRGRGVYLLRELGELAYDRLSIVQRWTTVGPAPTAFWG